jgi:hypothetical protein
MRIALSIISSKQWRVNTIDIKSAFLQGNVLEREIYIVPPKEADVTGKLWKLKKGVYGLNDAARKWYFAVFDELINLSCHRSSTDYGIFMWYNGSELEGILMSHVDDFLWAGTDAFIKSVITPLSTKFKVGKSCSSDSFKYVGINISQGANGISIDQNDYICTLSPIDVSRQKQINRNLACNAEETSAFCRLVGKLNWVANQTRPDILFDVCQLSAKMKEPLIKDLLYANKALNKIKVSPLKIFYPRLGDISKWKLCCFSDASLNNLESGKSAGGLLVCLINDAGRSCPLFWKSKTLRRVVRSTIAAETTAMVDALDVSFYLSHSMSEILSSDKHKNTNNSVNRVSPFPYCKQTPIVAYTDNESLYRNAYATTMVSEHRLRIDLAIIKQMLENKELECIKWLSSAEQLADCLTKKGADPIKLLHSLESGKILL